MPTPPPPVSLGPQAATGAVSFTVTAALLLYAVLTAVSVVWLGDWGRHGPAFARQYGPQQQLTIAFAGLLGLLLWLARDRLALAAVRGMAAWSAMPSRQRYLTGLAVAVGMVFVVGLLHWAHKLHTVPGLPGPLRPLLRWLSTQLLATGLLPVRPSVTVELLRLPACLLLAWALYRWQHANLSLRSNLLLALAVLASLVLGLWASQDKGPMLVVAIAVVFLGAAAIARMLPQALQSPGARLLVAGAAAGAGLALLMLALPHLTPADRLQAWRHPYSGKLEYLAQISWFMQAAAQADFGLGKTPWCGHLGALLGRCLGMPTETQSDYTLAALAGLWGPLAAWGLTAATACWLLCLIRLAAAAPAARHGIDAAGLAASTGGLYALMLLAQLFVTVLGNLGLLPLTGVPMPLLSWGRASMVGATLAMALVMPRPGGVRHQGMRHSLGIPALWAAVLPAATAGCLLAMLAVAAGLRQRLHDSPPAVLSSGRSNPWAPLAGCVRAADGSALQGMPLPAGTTAALCGQPPALQPVADAPNDPALRQALVQAAARTPVLGQRDLAGLRIPQRTDVSTTLSAALQARADHLANCLTGQATSACDGLVPAALAARYAQRLEGAAVRAVSLVTLRQRDGAVLAMADARSPCSVAQMDNTPRPAGCTPEAQRLLARPGRAGHQALRADDMVASTVKALLADAQLSMPGGGRWLHGAGRERMLAALASSNTAFFIDELLCFGAVGRPDTCPGPATLARRVAALQLADGIDLIGPGAPRLRLGGLPLALPAWPPTGPGAARELAAARRCHALPEKQRWRQCSGEQLAALVAPLWGQGNARSHPVAVAQIYLRIAAAARGDAHFTPPHLLPASAAPQPSGFETAHAALILEGLTRVPLLGTGRAACISVHGSAGCRGMGLAMKTGTSLFPQHAWTATERAARCRAVFDEQDRRRSASRPLPADLGKDALHCALYPMKWAVLLAPASAGVDATVTVVLVERNWDAASGRLDAGDDRGPNVAMEAALLLHARR